jgi:23S rRNA pseudouridine1911/1915/1917 synthase
MSSANILVPVAAVGQRLDRFVCEHAPGLGRAAARRLIDAGGVRVNGRHRPAGERLRDGDRIEIAELPASNAALADAAVPLRVCYEDACLVAVDKPAGMPSHPLRPGELGTLASALLARYPEMAGIGYSAREPGLLHRLDIETSGLVLAARDRETFDRLREQLARGEIDKRYLALCSGAPQAPALHRAWLSARGKQVNLRMQPFASAQPVETELLSSEVHGDCALVYVRVQRARRHQIRAHLSALGHPIVGDRQYGGVQLAGLSRHFLHASELRLRHPQSGAALVIQCELPEELRAVLAQLGRA